MRFRIESQGVNASASGSRRFGRVPLQRQKHHKWGWLIKLLLVENNPGDLLLLRQYLNETDFAPVDLTVCNRLSAALQRLEETTFEVILLDLSLPDSQGIETVRRIHSLAPSAPIVVLTGAVDEELGMEAVREGAQDYLPKGSLSPRLLGSGIQYALERSRARSAVTSHLLQNHAGLYSATLTLALSAESPHQARSFVASFAARAGFAAERAFDMQVAVSEACSNAFEHGGQKSVDLIGRLYVDRVEIDINSGSDFQLPSPKYLETTGKHRGMGLPLMAKLSDHFALYSRPEGGNQITLTFYLSGRVPPRKAKPLLPQSLQEVWQGKQLLETIVASISEGLLIYDENGRLLHMNPEASRILGTWGTNEHLPPVTAGAQQQSLRDVEIEIPKDDGRPTVVSCTAVPVMSDNGEPMLTLVTVNDITGHKRAEVALRQSEEKFRALAEENERLYRQQLEIAESLQAALLSIPSQIGAIKLGHLYRSASEAARIGGDFYDVFEVKDGKVAVLIGDVAGRGTEAARTATLVKDMVHAFTHQSLRTNEVLKRTNMVLIEKNFRDFVTLYLAILDKYTGHLRYSSAGHPETILKRASGEIQMLGCRSVPLGVYPDATWKPHAVDLNPNDVLLLYTDGVTEARNGDGSFGQKRLASLLKRRTIGGRIGVERLPQLVVDQVLAFSEGELKDDVAVLALTIDEVVRPRPLKEPDRQEKLLV